MLNGAKPGVPATGNHWLLTEVLRNELGFEGFVVTDYNADGELVNHGLLETTPSTLMTLMLCRAFYGGPYVLEPKRQFEILMNHVRP